MEGIQIEKEEKMPNYGGTVGYSPSPEGEGCQWILLAIVLVVIVALLLFGIALGYDAIANSTGGDSSNPPAQPPSKPQRTWWSNMVKEAEAAGKEVVGSEYQVKPPPGAGICARPDPNSIQYRCLEWFREDGNGTIYVKP